MAGCSGNGLRGQESTYFDGGATSETSAAPSVPAQASLLVNVFPAAAAATEGGLPLLPQTFAVEAAGAPSISVGRLGLDPVGTLSGQVTGFRPNPFVSATPGRDVPVGGSVFVERLGTVEQYRSVTDAKTGTYSLPVTRPGDYEVTVAPDDAALPLYTVQVSLPEATGPQSAGTQEGDLNIGLGVPVYGQVTAAGLPVENARVHVVDDLGHESATVRTDAQGRYLIRVAPEQSYTVVCEGVRSLHPIWSRRRAAQVDLGVQVDFPYPNDLEPREFATGEIVSGAPERSVDGTQFRAVATSLDGFEGLLEAGDGVTWSWEDTVDERGIVTFRVAPGTYELELIPPPSPASADAAAPDLAFSPLRLQDLSLPGAFGVQELPATQNAQGRLLGPAGYAIVGAIVTCEEDGFGSRSVSAVSDESGEVSLLLPDTPMTCEILPPQDLNGDATLATTFVSIAGADAFPAETVVTPGTLFIGTAVGADGAPLAFAWVEIRDEMSDRLLTYGITDPEGRFAFRGELVGATK